MYIIFISCHLSASSYGEHLWYDPAESCIASKRGDKATPSLIPPCPGPHNTVLKSFVSWKPLENYACAPSHCQQGDTEGKPSFSSLDPSGVNFLMPGALFILDSRVTLFSKFSTEVELQQQEFWGTLEPLQNPPRQSIQLLDKMQYPIAGLGNVPLQCRKSTQHAGVCEQPHIPVVSFWRTHCFQEECQC